ncbi:hypothetical protein KFL_015300015 [Klebsormidium nitens]|uniref:Integrase catalytic domain-containing protein n=1 Tax=Klebsormidium nitens TaxID=105231 RepID=A0A1Y1IXE9_KLENI|nr:hypothetical protein KFL_015300015 [Klebsormidium nitens]|eukprot:GAQ93437.1 hypothetical protein KFL_015300015 [Klebsormidium nitens]
MPVICQPKATWEDTCLLVREAESPVLWHRRLGHAGYENLAKMVEGPGLARGIRVKAKAFRELGRRKLRCNPGRRSRGCKPDRGGEYVNEGMTALLEKRGTVHHTTAGHSPEQNGLAERLNRTLEERARALLEDAGLKPELWAEAMVTANYTRNRVPSSVHGKTPWEMFYEEKPNLNHLRVFGARAYNPRAQGKLEEYGAG